jgi:hypothetical protein
VARFFDRQGVKSANGPGCRVIPRPFASQRNRRCGVLLDRASADADASVRAQFAPSPLR